MMYLQAHSAGSLMPVMALFLYQGDWLRSRTFYAHIRSGLKGNNHMITEVALTHWHPADRL